MNLTPELIDAVGKAVIGVIAAIGAIVATIASAAAAYYTYKNKHSLDIAHDRIREIKGEPLQYRYSKALAAAAVINQPAPGACTTPYDGESCWDVGRRFRPEFCKNCELREAKASDPIEQKVNT